MEVGLPRERKFLVCGVYREWAHLRSGIHPHQDSGCILEQEKRWDTFLDAWEDALDDVEDVTVMGDVNIDLHKVFVGRNHHCRKMAENLRLRILSRGVI